MWLVGLPLLQLHCSEIANTYSSTKVSQFTLLASTKKGSKPDFHGAAGGEKAKELYDHFYAKVREIYDPEKVKNGVFQAMMEVGLVNDGPVGVDYRCEEGAVNARISILNLMLVELGLTTFLSRSGYYGDTNESAKNREGKRGRVDRDKEGLVRRASSIVT